MVSALALVSGGTECGLRNSLPEKTAIMYLVSGSSTALPPKVLIRSGRSCLRASLHGILAGSLSPPLAACPRRAAARTGGAPIPKPPASPRLPPSLAATVFFRAAPQDLPFRRSYCPPLVSMGRSTSTMPVSGLIRISETSGGRRDRVSPAKALGYCRTKSLRRLGRAGLRKTE